MFQGFKEHIGTELPDEVGTHSDPEALARELFDRAEAAFLTREEELGTELVLKVFRHLYLEELDKAWVEHLTDMDHLRDGIGLRGYGQKDPKQEYKKEGYNMFVNTVASVSSNVVTKLFAWKSRSREEEERSEAADLARHAAELAKAVAAHDDRVPTQAPPAPEPAVTAEMECPCGSGKAFAACHGAEG